MNELIRGVITLCGMLFGYGVSHWLLGFIPESIGYQESDFIVLTALVIALFGLIFNKLFGSLSKRGENFIQVVSSDLAKVPALELFAGAIGLMAGVVMAYLISSIVNGIELLKVAYINTIISVLLYVFLGIAGMQIAKRLSKEMRFPTFGSSNLTTAKTKSKQQTAAPKILDTSAIIDGRITEVLDTGFLEGAIIIPEFVLVELRHIADSSDALKRNRGRRGLDILNEIQEDYGVDIYGTEQDKALEEIPEVDVKLIKLAQKLKGDIVTNDYNLNKVASIQGVKVLNINELANVLKPKVISGEILQVAIVKEGKTEGQGVAYLDDGTMIVIADGKQYIGQTLNVVVESVLQTAAGRLIFAKADFDAGI